MLLLLIPCSHIPHTGLQNSWTHSSGLKIIKSSHPVITGMAVPKGMLAKSPLYHVPETTASPPWSWAALSLLHQHFFQAYLQSIREALTESYNDPGCFGKKINAKCWHGTARDILGYIVESHG